MNLCRQRGQLSGAPGNRRRPPARFSAPRGHPGDSTPQNRHRSLLLPWSCRVLPEVCEEFRSHRRPTTCPDQEDAVFHWSAACQDAFDRLKTLLTTSPITAFPDFSQSFRLYTEASTAGLGAILAQVREGKQRIIYCTSRSLNQAEKAYPATKIECLTIVWAVAKFRPYLMAMPFEVYTDHYALQWLKTMRTGSALLHSWLAALEEYDFTVKHQLGKAQTHVDGLSRLPGDPTSPEDVLLHICLLENEDEVRKLAKELHSTTHLGGQALWKLFRDRYNYKAGRCICLEVAQSCPQCQLGSDYGHRQKTTGAIQSQRTWDTLSIDIVGPLPADHRQEFLIMFVNCYSRYTILVPSSNHTANTVSEALLRHVVPYFSTPRRLLSDQGREFVSEIWSKLLHSLGIQRVLISPYHPEGNAINERSHRTLNNMLRTRLLEGSSSKAWVDKVPGIMLSLNAMPHEPHGFSTPMIATGREPTLPPDVQQDAHASPAVDDPSEYVGVITQRLQLTHQQIASPSPPSIANPYQEGSLIFAMTTPPEHTSKLAPRWKGSFRVCRVPNDYQVVYEDGEVQRTIHVNHTKPAKFTAPDLPEPVPAPETPRPHLGYHPAELLGPRPPHPAPTTPAWGCSSSSTTASTANQPAAPAESKMQPPATAPANQRPEPAPRPRRSPRLNPEPARACAIKGPTGNPPHQSAKTSRMARTYPLTVPYNQCLGNRADPLSFASLRLVDLRNGQSQYLSTLKQLVDALLRTIDPSSRYALRGHITHQGQKRLRHSM